MPVVRDRPAADDTGVVTVDEIEAAYAAEREATPKRRGRRLRRFLSFLLVIAILIGIAFVVLWGLTR